MVENFGHGKHVNAVLFEDCAHRLIAYDLAPVGRILEVMGVDILPYFLHGLWTRELSKQVRGSSSANDNANLDLQQPRHPKEPTERVIN